MIYVVYMYTIEKQKQQEQQKEKQREKIINSLTMQYKIRTQTDILTVEMRIRRYLRSKNIENVKDITILNWKEMGV